MKKKDSYISDFINYKSIFIVMISFWDKIEIKGDKVLRSWFVRSYFLFI